MTVLDEKLADLEHRLDAVDNFYAVLTKEFMNLEPSEFKCNVCEQLQLTNMCNKDESICPFKNFKKKKANEI